MIALQTVFYRKKPKTEKKGDNRQIEIDWLSRAAHFCAICADCAVCADCADYVGRCCYKKCVRCDQFQHIVLPIAPFLSRIGFASWWSCQIIMNGKLTWLDTFLLELVRELSLTWGNWYLSVTSPFGLMCRMLVFWGVQYVYFCLTCRRLGGSAVLSLLGEAKYFGSLSIETFNNLRLSFRFNLTMPNNVLHMLHDFLKSRRLNPQK